jgi:uncharacterized surface protein with fasciclin (FAS1) repeats
LRSNRKALDKPSYGLIKDITMKNTTKLAALMLILGGTSVLAAEVTMVGGEGMFPSKNIIDNAVKSKDHTTLVAAVKAAGLVDTLKGPGPFTVFAPTNNAFSALPEGTVDNLLKPESKEALVKILAYHVVPGRLEFADLAREIKTSGGKAKLKTVAGETLTAMMNGDHNITLRDSKGGVADISTYDVVQSNGVIHVIDKVIIPYFIKAGT